MAQTSIVCLYNVSAGKYKLRPSKKGLKSEQKVLNS